MSKIKTRKKGKDIKLLDKSAVVGQRMKNALIRSKRSATALMDDRQATPGEYAEDKVRLAAGDLVHDAANVAASGAKTAVRQGRTLFQRQREKKAAEKRRENTATTGQALSPETPPSATPEGQPPHQRGGTAPEGRLPRQKTGTAPEGQRPRQYAGTVECRQSPARADVDRPADAADPLVERGQAFAQKQAAKRTEHKRQTKNRAVQSGRPARMDPQDAAKAPRQLESVAHAVETPIKRAKRPAQAIGQTTKASGRGASGTVKRAQRTVKTAGRTGKGTVKTAQRTSKAAIKTAERTAKAAQKTAQATAKAAKVTAQAVRATAKAAATAAKATAKAVAATVKGILAAAKALIAAIVAGGWVAVLVIVIVCLIGLIAGSCFGIFFSGEDGGTGQTMPAAVREINQEHEDRLEKIKADNPHDVLEMSGSRAVWPEVLAVYAVKTTTGPDGQEVATMDDGKKDLLKEIFWAMNEIGYRTASVSETVTTETDDGEGNIVETQSTVKRTYLYITVSHKTAEEMADELGFNAGQRRQLAELLAEENRGMWSAALYGIGDGNGAIVTVALSQVGNIGGEPYWSWYGFDSQVEWCACFVSWCANECGYLDAGVIPKFAGCVTGSQWFKDRGLWQEKDYGPRPGDLIFFDWDDGDTGQDGFPDHVGIVEKVEDGTVYTVEGNSGDRCRQKSYPVGYYEIYGYGTPAY